MHQLLRSLCCLSTQHVHGLDALGVHDLLDDADLEEGHQEHVHDTVEGVDITGLEEDVVLQVLLDDDLVDGDQDAVVVHLAVLDPAHDVGVEGDEELAHGVAHVRVVLLEVEPGRPILVLTHLGGTLAETTEVLDELVSHPLGIQGDLDVQQVGDDLTAGDVDPLGGDGLVGVAVAHEDLHGLLEDGLHVVVELLVGTLTVDAALLLELLDNVLAQPLVGDVVVDLAVGVVDEGVDDAGLGLHDHLESLEVRRLLQGVHHLLQVGGQVLGVGTQGGGVGDQGVDDLTDAGVGHGELELAHSVLGAVHGTQLVVVTGEVLVLDLLVVRHLRGQLHVQLRDLVVHVVQREVDGGQGQEAELHDLRVQVDVQDAVLTRGLVLTEVGETVGRAGVDRLEVAIARHAQGRGVGVIQVMTTMPVVVVDEVLRRPAHATGGGVPEHLAGVVLAEVPTAHLQDSHGDAVGHGRPGHGEPEVGDGLDHLGLEAPCVLLDEVAGVPQRHARGEPAVGGVVQGVDVAQLDQLVVVVVDGSRLHEVLGELALGHGGHELVDHGREVVLQALLGHEEAEAPGQELRADVGQVVRVVRREADRDRATEHALLRLDVDHVRDDVGDVAVLGLELLVGHDVAVTLDEAPPAHDPAVEGQHLALLVGVDGLGLELLGHVTHGLQEAVVRDDEVPIRSCVVQVRLPVGDVDAELVDIDLEAELRGPGVLSLPLGLLAVVAREHVEHGIEVVPGDQLALRILEEDDVRGGAGAPGTGAVHDALGHVRDHLFGDDVLHDAVLVTLLQLDELQAEAVAVPVDAVLEEQEAVVRTDAVDAERTPGLLLELHLSRQDVVVLTQLHEPVVEGQLTLVGAVGDDLRPDGVAVTEADVGLVDVQLVLLLVGGVRGVRGVTHCGDLLGRNPLVSGVAGHQGGWVLRRDVGDGVIVHVVLLVVGVGRVGGIGHHQGSSTSLMGRATRGRPQAYELVCMLVVVSLTSVLSMAM